MNILTVSDLAAGLGGFVNTMVHHRSRPEMEALYSVLCSMAGRWGSSMLGGFSFVNMEAKNQAIVFLTRVIIAELMHQGHKVEHGFDSCLSDLLGELLSKAVPSSITPNFLNDVYHSQTNPVPGSSAASLS
jgi:hypothetical protein